MATMAKQPTHTRAEAKDGGLTDAGVLALLHEQRSTEDGAVHRNEGQEDAQRTVQRGGEFLDDHLDQLHHGCDDRNEHDEAQEAEVYSGVLRAEPGKRAFFEDKVLEEVVDGDRDAQNENHRESKANGRLHCLGDGEVRAHAQEVGEDHVLYEDPLDE